MGIRTIYPDPANRRTGLLRGPVASRDDVKLHSIQQSVVVDWSGMRRSSSKTLQVRFPCTSEIVEGD
jgi:hypothetical protein